MPAGVVHRYRPSSLVWCLTICHACWCGVIIGHAFWYGASLSAMPVGVVPHYRPCLLVWCLTISHACWCGASLYATPSGVGCLIISHGFWCVASLRDLFHVYLNNFEFHFLRLHINKTNTCCFFMHNGHVPVIAK